MSAVQRAVSQAEAESKSLQLQLLDLESEVLFDFNSLQDELLAVQNMAEDVQRQLEESEQKRYGVRLENINRCTLSDLPIQY